RSRPHSCNNVRRGNSAEKSTQYPKMNRVCRRPALSVLLLRSGKQGASGGMQRSRGGVNRGWEQTTLGPADPHPGRAPTLTPPPRGREWEGATLATFPRLLNPSCRRRDRRDPPPFLRIRAGRKSRRRYRL